MVFLSDEGDYFAAPLSAVWSFMGSGKRHAEAHHHLSVRRKSLGARRGVYSWVQPFGSKAQRFTMRWSSFPPVGILFEVLAGPFRGSTFFLLYRPRGNRTYVSLFGEFLSPTLSPRGLPSAVRRFFAREFEQDRAALERRVAAGRPGGRAPSATERARPGGGAGLKIG